MMLKNTQTLDTTQNPPQIKYSATDKSTGLDIAFFPNRREMRDFVRQNNATAKKLSAKAYHEEDIPKEAS